MDAVLVAAGGGALGRPHVAKALIAGGFVKDSREAFDRYLAAGKPGYVEKERLEIAEGIRFIHEAGGIAIVAHPGARGRRERIEPLVALGLDGLEVRHPSHSSEDMKRIAALAAHFGLVPSGGSDWHGAMHGGRVLGALQVPLAWLDAQDARVAQGARDERAARGVVLVTGAGQRVGQVIARHLGAHGWRVAVHHGASVAGAAATVEAIRGAGGDAEAFRADLREADAAPELIGAVVAHFGSLDALVNSAAGMERSPIGGTTAADFDRIIALNLRAPFLLAQAAAGVLRDGRGHREHRRSHGG
jgi:hypothetical protein